VNEETGKAEVNDVCDYIILMCCEAGEKLNLLKLQKLLYYVQAWGLAFDGEPFFDGKFQAWVHGPVNRQIFDRFKDSKTLYSRVGIEDILPDFDPDTKFTAEHRHHIQSVLEVYASLGDSDLEAQTHSEDPWIQARGDCRPTQRCEAEISEETMGAFYKKRMEEAAK
jgi:uncharacterized phage-associated protein